MHVLLTLAHLKEAPTQEIPTTCRGLTQLLRVEAHVNLLKRLEES